MPTMRIHCAPRYDLGGRRGLSRSVHILDEGGAHVPRFELMCESIDSDIPAAGATVLKYIEQVECGIEDLVEADGNGWVTHIAKDKVWFEGLYSQGEGGAVSLAQYKLAVQTYIRFLTDPEHVPIEVEFSAQ